MPLSDRYEIEILRQAEKDLDALKNRRTEAARAILALEENPELGHALTGALQGARALEFNLKGSGAYRAVYTVLDEERLCIVLSSVPMRTSTRKQNAAGNH